MLIDGLQCGHFSRDIFIQLLSAGVGCVTVTCGFWEDPIESLEKIASWRDLVNECSDIAVIATSAETISQAMADGKLAIILGFQNTDLFGNRIRFVELFAELGVRVVQLTYNNQNSLGSSCYEDVDQGLARFGKEVIYEMNASGILIDLSHVGDRTSLGAIEYSQKPVAITHANMASLVPHKRNKSDEVVKLLAERGGVLGCTTYRNITGDEYCRSVEAWAGMIARTVDFIGIDAVGIGTDRGHNLVETDYNWMRMGRWTRGIDYGAASSSRPGKAAPPEWFIKLQHLDRIKGGLASVGFDSVEVEKILSGNWIRLYQDVFAKPS